MHGSFTRSELENPALVDLSAATPARYDPPDWAGSLSPDAGAGQRWWRRSILRAIEEPQRDLLSDVGQRPAPPFDLPGRFAPLESVEDDPLYRMIERATVAIISLAFVGMIAQLLRAWIGGAL